jgi:hypothetical protein
MEKGDFKRLVRTLRNWKNEGIQIKRNDPAIDEGTKIEEDNIRSHEDGDDRGERDG